MIKFKRIKYCNLLATGNAPIEIDLNTNKTTLIIGNNGSGKSTVLDALCFVLFGKGYRKVNKGALINTTNQKGLLVEVEFDIHDTPFKIIRGSKPEIFEIYKNGVLIDQTSDVRDYQAMLEQSILRVNQKTFTQIAVLGSALFVPFMELKAADRRAVVENFLDILIFSVMNEVAKEQFKEKKAELQNIQGKISVIEAEIAALNKTIERLERDNTEKLKGLENDYNELLEKSSSYRKEWKVLTEEINKLKATFKTDTKLKTKIESLLGYQSTIDTKLKTELKTKDFFLTNGECPTCKQEIEPDHANLIVNDADTRIAEYEDGLKKIKNQIGLVREAINEQEQRIEEIVDQEREAERKIMMINNIERQLEDVQEQIKKLKSEDEHSSLGEHREDKKVKLVEYEDMKDIKHSIETDIEYHKAIISMLMDDGIKTRVVKQYLPIINKTINTFLGEMNFFADFYLDENFNETIRSSQVDKFSYENFSQGEKMRIDHALLFTWIHVARLKNSFHTNILFFDEVLDGSLDRDGITEFMKIVNRIGKDINVFIISHKREMVENFDEVLEFKKIKGFSELTKVE